MDFLQHDNQFIDCQGSQPFFPDIFRGSDLRWLYSGLTTRLAPGFCVIIACGLRWFRQQLERLIDGQICRFDISSGCGHLDLGPLLVELDVAISSLVAQPGTPLLQFLLPLSVWGSGSEEFKFLTDGPGSLEIATLSREYMRVFIV